MINRCENCTGERREQCEAIFDGYRGKTPQTDMVSGEPIIWHELQDIGCTLTTAELHMGFGIDLLSEVQILANQAALDGDIDPEKRDALEEIADSSFDLLRGVQPLVRKVHEDIKSAAEIERALYCDEQNWDPDNLTFDQKMDVRAHLRSMDLL